MLTIRPATETDFDDVLRVQAAAFGEYAGLYEVSAWTTETRESLARDAREKQILVAEIDRDVVGSVRFWTLAGVCVVRLLSVSPPRQGQGIAKSLMREVEARAGEAHKLYACTMLKTARNIALFQRLDYHPETILPNHYHHLDLICFAKYR